MFGTLASCKEEEGKVFYGVERHKGTVVYIAKGGDYIADYPNSYLLYVDTGAGYGPLEMLLITEDTILAPSGGWDSILKGQLAGFEIEGVSEGSAEGVYYLYPRLYLMHTVNLVETEGK